MSIEDEIQKAVDEFLAKPVFYMVGDPDPFGSLCVPVHIKCTEVLETYSPTTPSNRQQSNKNGIQNPPNRQDATTK